MRMDAIIVSERSAANLPDSGHVVLTFEVKLNIPFTKSYYDGLLEILGKESLARTKVTLYDGIGCRIGCFCPDSMTVEGCHTNLIPARICQRCEKFIERSGDD